MNISISEKTYNQLIEYLKVNAETDADAKTLLEKIKAEGKSNYRLESGAIIIDGNLQKQIYSV